MTDARYWSKEFMIEFIELYKSYPCLWKVNCKDYTNKILKKTAYDKMVELCKRVNANPNRDFVVKKIQSIRGSFRKEVNKVKASMKTATCPEELYTSSLWYYDHLLFTKDQDFPTGSASNMTEETDSMEYEEENEPVEHFLKFENENSEIESRPEMFSTTGVKRKYSETTETTERPKVSDDTQQWMEMCKTAFSVPSNKLNISEYDAVGINVTKKLNRMNPHQALLAENLISTVLLKGLLNKLTEETSLCNGKCNMLATIPHSTGHFSGFAVKCEEVSPTTSTNLLNND